MPTGRTGSPRPGPLAWYGRPAGVGQVRPRPGPSAWSGLHGQGHPRAGRSFNRGAVGLGWSFGHGPVGRRWWVLVPYSVRFTVGGWACRMS